MDHFRQQFIDAVKLLETRWPGLTPHTLNDLRTLLTPDARAEVLPLLSMDTITTQLLHTKCEEVRRRMWLGWHWQSAPDELIHPTRRMSLHLALCARCSLAVSVLAPGHVPFVGGSALFLWWPHSVSRYALPSSDTTHCRERS